MPPLFQDLQTLSGSDVYLIFVTYPPPPPYPGSISRAGSPEWTRLKGLKLLIATCIDIPKDFLAAEELFPSGSYPKTRLHWGGGGGGEMAKNGLKRHKNRVECLDQPFSLPRLYLLVWLALFFFLSFECSPNCGARSQTKLIAMQDFVFLNSLTWISFCTSKTLFPFPSHPTHNFSYNENIHTEVKYIMSCL